MPVSDALVREQYIQALAHVSKLEAQVTALTTMADERLAVIRELEDTLRGSQAATIAVSNEACQQLAEVHTIVKEFHEVFSQMGSNPMLAQMFGAKPPAAMPAKAYPLNRR